jgi:hypothetical protein
MRRLGLSGNVQAGDVITWTNSAPGQFDAAIGNPPFVRFQFVPPETKGSIDRLQDRIGLSFAGVSNLWLPVLMSTLTTLRIGGAFAFIVPAECFTGISAGLLRQWLVGNSTELRFDLFPPGSFPGVLQEIVILSGRKKKTAKTASRCRIVEHHVDGSADVNVHVIPHNSGPWTRYLLSKNELGAFEEAEQLTAVSLLSDVAKFEVSAVTGANNYFSVCSETVKRFDLEPWAVPLLPRTRHATGLRYTDSDHDTVEATGAKTHLLDFSAERPDPNKYAKARRYLSLGVEEGLPSRYKCRIRSPWYRIPFIRRGDLMLSKRCHRFPRVVLNELGVVTTDTIYRGTMTHVFRGRESDLVAAFHNSLTLLSAEIEGRSFGGGVLELVPSEIARLRVPMPPDFGQELDRLDALARSTIENGRTHELIHETDLLLAKAGIGFTPSLIDQLHAANQKLLHRRLARNGSSS